MAPLASGGESLRGAPGFLALLWEEQRGQRCSARISGAGREAWGLQASRGVASGGS